VSHRNHRGNICGVDFIWLLNPNKCRKPLKTSWNEAVFGIIKVSSMMNDVPFKNMHIIFLMKKYAYYCLYRIEVDLEEHDK
jgi:hypothetical protein